MRYCCSYRLKSGKWDNTWVFKEREQAEEVMTLYAQGRVYLICQTWEELERKKKETDKRLPTPAPGSRKN
jgi:hypothetical protein